MSRAEQICACTCLVAAVAGVFLQGLATLRGAPQQGSNDLNSLRAGLAVPAKPTWHGGPASTPPEPEAVPPPPAVRPPTKSLILGPQKGRSKLVSATEVGAPAAVSIGSARPTSWADNKPIPKLN